MNEQPRRWHDELSAIQLIWWAQFRDFVLVPVCLVVAVGLVLALVWWAL